MSTNNSRFGMILVSLTREALEGLQDMARRSCLSSECSLCKQEKIRLLEQGAIQKMLSFSRWLLGFVSGYSSLLPFYTFAMAVSQHIHTSKIIKATLTPSLSCHFKTTNTSVKFETLKPFCLLFSHWHVKGFSSKYITLKIYNLLDRNVYCL